MSGIDINSMDDNWKKYAKGADEADRESDAEKTKGDGILNLGSVFEKQAFIRLARADHKTDEEIKAFFAANGADMKDINAIFQLELSNTNAQKTSPSRKSEKRANNAAEKEIAASILQEGSRFYTNNNGTLKDVIDWNGIADAFVQYYSNDTNIVVNQEYYKKLAAEVKNVANAMNNVKYNSRHQVEAIYDYVQNNVLSKMPKDEFSEFRTSVLKSFALLAESHQKAKEQQKVNWEYQTLRQHGKSREEAYNAIKADKKFQGSYYSTYKKPDYVDRFNGKVKEYDHKGIVDSLEDNVILEDARKEIYDAVWAQRGKTHLTTSKQIEDEAEKLIHQDKYTNRIMHKNLRGEMSFKQRIEGENSRYKDLRKAVAAYNRVENNKVKAYSRDDFYKGAFKGKNADLKFNQLSKSGYVLGQDGQPLKDKNGNPISYNPVITQAVDAQGKPMTDKNGNPLYNLSRVSDIIKRAISPADMKANYDSDKESSYAEITNVIRDIYTATTVYDPDDNTKIIQEGITISYEDTCHLIDMCGFERDKWTVGYFLRTVGKAAIDTVSDVASTAATALIVGAAQGDPLIHVEQAITHVTDPKAHAETNIDKITAALLGMSKSLGTINPNNGVNLSLNWRINVKVNGEKIDVDSSINEYDIYSQLDQQLASLNLPDDAYGIQKGSDGFWHLWLNIPSDEAYEDIRKVSEILGDNFDLKTDTGIPFEANAVIDEKGQIVTDKPAEAVVDDKGKASTTKKLQAFLWGTAIGFGLNLLKECLKGLKNTDIDLTNTIIEEEDLAHYAARLSKERIAATPKLKDALLQIAKLFEKEDGTWDRVAYQTFINELAGGRSMLNARELEIGIIKWQKEHEPTLEPKKVEKPTETKVETPKTKVQDRPIPEDTYFTAQERISGYTGEYTKGVRWDSLAKQYDDLDKYVKKSGDRVRMMKVIQGVNNNNYTLENLKKLTELSFKVGADLAKLRSSNKSEREAELKRIKTALNRVFKDVQGFDVNEYMKAFVGDIIGDQKTPEIIVDNNTRLKRNKNIADVVDKNGSGGNSIRSGMAKDKNTKELDVTVDKKTRTFKDGEQQQAEQYILETDQNGPHYDYRNSRTDLYFNGKKIE